MLCKSAFQTVIRHLHGIGKQGTKECCKLAVGAKGRIPSPLWWWRRPPQHAHRAAALTIAILQVSLVGQLLAIPDPVIATLQVVLAIGTAYFLIDLRWMLSVQAFGIACWLAATRLVEPTAQWQIAHFVTLVGYGAAASGYFGMNKIYRLSRENEELGEEAQKAASALRVSEERLRNAQRIAQVGSFEWDLETDVVFWSDEQYRLLGWKPEEIPLDSAFLLQTIHADDRGAVVKAVDDSLDRLATVIHSPERIQGIWHGSTRRCREAGQRPRSWRTNRARCPRPRTRRSSTRPPWTRPSVATPRPRSCIAV